MSETAHRIAVVDDDARLLESLENLFESAGYAVSLFASARALVEAGFAGIDCLVTDIGMPGMDGFELSDLARRARRDLPVFLITGRDVMGDQQRATSGEITGFFRKPFDGPALLAAVSDALRS